MSLDLFKYYNVDFHSHILPKMDDGSKSSEMSLQMLAAMKDYGTDLVVSTSHFYRRREDISSFLERRSASYEHLKTKLTGSEPQIRLGAEVAFYFGIEEDPELEKLCIEGTHTMLLEMPFAVWTDYELNAVSRICSERGINLVIAHYERYEEFQKGNRLYEEMLRLPVKIQVNGESLLPLFSRGKYIKWFESGRAQILGSDAHNMDKRKPNLGPAREILRKKLGQEILDDIDKESNLLLGINSGLQISDTK